MLMYSSGSGSSSAAAALGVVVFLLFTFIIVWLLVYVLVSFFLSKMFKKAGIEGWMAWVPFLNSWKMLEMGGYAGWWIFIPFANLIFMILAAHNISKAFGKGGGYTVLYILFPFIWVILLASSSLPWQPQLMAPSRPLAGNAAGGSLPYGGAQPAYGGQQPYGGGAQPGYGGQPYGG